MYAYSGLRKTVSRVGLAIVLVAGTAVSFDGAFAQSKTLVVAIDSDPGQFNPAVTTGAHVHAVADSLFNGLVGLDAELQPIPDLATDWTVSSDGRVYTFNLAEAKWHDGKPVTSQDVKFTFENVLFKHHARTKSGLSKLVEAIETPDQSTVVFRLGGPHPALLRRLNVTEAPILPAHIYAGVENPANTPANTNPIGSGPYRFESHTPGDRVVLSANPDYFKTSRPKIDRVVFRIIKDASTRILAFEQGEVDYIPRISGKDIARIEATDNGGVLFATAGPGGGNCIMTVSFNLERSATAELAVRKALALTVDRNRLLDQVLFGRGTVAAAPFSSAIGWAHDSKALSKLEKDSAEAEALLEGAGFQKDANGVRLKLDMVHYPNFTKYSELMAQDLAKIGIELTPRPLDREAAIDAIFMKRDFDTNLISYCNGVDPEIGIKRMYVSNNIGPIPFSNASAYRSKVVDEFFAEAGATADEGARAMAYRKVQAVLAKDLPYWWLVETTRNTAYNKDFQGFKPWTGHYLENVGPAS